MNAWLDAKGAMIANPKGTMNVMGHCVSKVLTRLTHKLVCTCLGRCLYVLHHNLVIVPWLAVARDRCIQQSGISIQEVSVHLNSIEEFEWWVLTVTLPTWPELFAGLRGWTYCWNNVVELWAGCYCSLHLLKCQDGWLVSLLTLPMTR